jgi:hypothetical protein
MAELEVEIEPGSLRARHLACLIELSRRNPSSVDEIRDRHGRAEPIIIQKVVVDADVVAEALRRISAAIVSVPSFGGSSSSSSAAPAVLAALQSPLAPPAPIPNPPAPIDGPMIAAVAPAPVAESTVLDFVGFEGALEVVFNAARGVYELYHNVTKERVELPACAGGWAMVIDDDGMGATLAPIVDDDSGGTLDPEDILQHCMWVRPSDKEVFVQSKGLPSKKIVSLIEFRAAHASYEIKVQATSSTACDVLRLVVFNVPRDGYRAFICIASLLDALGVARKSKTTREYINHQEIAWNRVAEQFGLAGIVRAIPYSVSFGTGPDDGTRVLKEKSGSFPVAFLLLCRWAFCKRQGGGMTNDADRARAVDLVTRLCNFLVCANGFSISLCSIGGHMRHESGVVLGSASSHVRISALGMVDFSEIVGDAPISGSRTEFWQASLDELFGRSEPTIVEICKAIVVDWDSRSIHLKSLGRQLLWALGERFDTLVASAMDGQALLAPGVQMLDCIVPLSIAEEVALYYQGVVEHARIHGQTFVSGCMGKSSVQSYNMQLAPICLSNKSAFWTVPQATPSFVQQTGFLCVVKVKGIYIFYRFCL